MQSEVFWMQGEKFYTFVLIFSNSASNILLWETDMDLNETPRKKIVNKIKVQERIWEIIIKWTNCDIANW